MLDEPAPPAAGCESRLPLPKRALRRTVSRPPSTSHLTPDRRFKPPPAPRRGRRTPLASAVWAPTARFIFCHARVDHPPPLSGADMTRAGDGGGGGGNPLVERHGGGGLGRCVREARMMGMSAGASSREPTRQETGAEHTRTPTTECRKSGKVVCGMVERNTFHTFVEIATRFQASMWPSRTFVQHKGGVVSCVEESPQGPEVTRPVGHSVRAHALLAPPGPPRASLPFTRSTHTRIRCGVRFGRP